MNKAIINNRVYLELLSIIISQLDPNASCLECLDRNLLSASDRERDRYPINRSALNDLQVMQDEIIAVADSKAIFGYALIILLKPSIANSELAAAQKRLGEAITRINRLTDIIGLLLTNFGDSGLKLTIEVKTELGVIDLFVKMADLRNFALMLRSNGNNYIMWQKDRKQFYIRHTGIRGLKHWGTTTQILETFNLQTNWLQKVKSPIIGSTASQRKKPIIRAIVLTGETELDKLHHDPEAKVDFGRTKVVKIDAGYTTYLLQSIDLVKFLMPPVES
ncbi:hypothetical protein [Chamaesiphon sp.]|uniref:hypothetical protein n=1 Tax=Chamaesiphon sp. TaxID=2814140 RepID=UPI0035937BFB